SGGPWDPAQLDAFSTLIGRTPAIFMWYQDWAHSGFKRDMMDAVVARNAMPLVTWEPWDSSGGTNQPNYALRYINAGNFDAYIHQWARDAAAWGHPMYLRFAHEMNANWYPWCASVNGNTAAEYVAAWRRVVGIFRAEGATNVRFVWSPNILSG